MAPNDGGAQGADNQTLDQNNPGTDPNGGGAAVAVPDPNAGGNDPAGDKKKSPPWFVTAINKEREEKEALAREFAATKARMEAAEAALQAKSGAAAPAQTNANSATTTAAIKPEDIEKLVDERASIKAADAAFNQACNAAYEAGKAGIEGFEQAVSGLAMVGATKNRTFLEAVTAMPEPHKVLHQLGTNLEEAQRISSLPPVRMAVELARISSGLSGGTQQVSSAPPPLRMVGGSAKTGTDLADPKTPMNDWVKEREKTARRR